MVTDLSRRIWSKGYTNTELLIISDGLYAYQEDTSDGYDTATYEPYSLTEAIFVGGQDDGTTPGLPITLCASTILSLVDKERGTVLKKTIV